MVFTTYAKTPNLCTPTLNPPTGGVLSVTDPKWIGVSTDPPFTLSGAPVTTIPVKTPNQMVNYCPGLDQQTPPQPLRKEITLDTSGLIQDPVLKSGTTLRITNERVSFTLVFIALHKNIWSDTTASPQLSLFFTGRDPVDGLIVYTHICIPVTYTTDDLNTNLFLNSWLKNTPPPLGLTVNNLLDAKRGLKLQVMNYCLRNQVGGTSYTLFLSSEPLLLNSTNLPSWLAADTNLTGNQWINESTYRLKTFSDMYTFAMNVRNPTYTEFFNWNEITVTKTNNTKKNFVSIMSGSPTQSGITPSYYVLPPGSLSGTALTKGQRTLPKKQIKCYPINLMKDVDENGNVIVNSDNVPMTTSGAANEKQSETMNLKLDDKTVNAQNNTFVIIASIFIGLFALVFILGIIFWLFGGKQSPSVTMAAAVAGAAAILPDPLPPPPGGTLLPPPPPPPPPSGTLPPPLPSPP